MKRAGAIWCLLLLCSSQPAAVEREKPRPTLSCGAATHSLDDFKSGATSLPSPDGAKRILFAKDFSLRVLREEKEIGAAHVRDLSSNIQVLWAPDSDKFSLTYSDGGSEGTFFARVYEITQGGVIEVPKPPRVASDDFSKRYLCKARGNNILAVGWTDDSAALLLLTAVYDTSDCGEIMGRSNAYLVDLGGKVLARYGDKSARAIEGACNETGRAVLPLPSPLRRSR